MGFIVWGLRLSAVAMGFGAHLKHPDYKLQTVLLVSTPEGITEGLNIELWGTLCNNH